MYLFWKNRLSDRQIRGDESKILLKIFKILKKNSNLVFIFLRLLVIIKKIANYVIETDGCDFLPVGMNCPRIQLNGGSRDEVQTEQQIR